ncbi:unnamed protein product [Acanthoscelides obtectus]|uniref:Uncharacterized protein n=1 Tax=Acanthoscelides obtectus TaxID=200917 RepID=A0A9P0KA68_ACAOB|nr:unnamed protein product [Acanthoscelides obtectus]CAK1629408.1 hypothetical protein AOBTE_LOCUS5724 [Acanthoscelides obtectus]
MSPPTTSTSQTTRELASTIFQGACSRILLHLKWFLLGTTCSTTCVRYCFPPLADHRYQWSMHRQLSWTYAPGFSRP